jgi:hypothetical protein
VLAINSRGERGFFDPLNFGAPYHPEAQTEAMTEAFALTIQRARDEEKCREAWVAFAAACLSHGYGFGDADPRAAGHESYYDPPGAATCADSLLREYRSRFCPEVES